jgi:hypothetical protein
MGFEKGRAMNAASKHLVRIGRTCGALALAVCLSACGGGQQSTTASVATGPDAFLGVWVADKAPRELLTVEGKAPPLNDAAARLYSERKQRFATGDASFDQTTWCASPGMPRVMTMSYPFEIRQDGNHLAFIYGWYRWFRTVNMKSGAVDVPSPLTMGFPVGSWENDSLVIRTTGLIDTTVLDASGLPHSEMLTLTERLRVLPDGRLEDRITIEDPETFTEAWETALTFHRDAAARVSDDVCPDRMAAGEPAERTDSAAAAPTVKSVSTPRAEVTHSKTATAPRLSGIWEPKTFVVMIPDAPLNSAGKEIADRNAAANKAGRILQTAWVSCRPGAVSTMTMPREKIVILESSDEITMLFEMPRMVRRIRLDASHPDNLVPSYVGDSVGRWEGNTLVVDSVGFNGFAELDARGLPTSPRLHTVERFSVASDGSIEVETTITDPEYYDKPLTIKRSWKKSEASHPLEYDCSENPRQEDFENAYYVRERYRPVCMRVEGEGMELSKMVCDRPK